VPRSSQFYRDERAVLSAFALLSVILRRESAFAIAFAVALLLHLLFFLSFSAENLLYPSPLNPKDTLRNGTQLILFGVEWRFSPFHAGDPPCSIAAIY
jgi:hypothetical protein